jgi:hypothetical protein
MQLYGKYHFSRVFGWLNDNHENTNMQMVFSLHRSLGVHLHAMGVSREKKFKNVKTGIESISTKTRMGNRYQA